MLDELADRPRREPDATLDSSRARDVSGSSMATCLPCPEPADRRGTRIGPQTWLRRFTLLLPAVQDCDHVQLAFNLIKHDHAAGSIGGWAGKSDRSTSREFPLEIFAPRTLVACNSESVEHNGEPDEPYHLTDKVKVRRGSSGTMRLHAPIRSVSHRPEGLVSNVLDPGVR